MLGDEQERWLQAGLRTSTARWNLFAQQTPMAQASQVPVKGIDDGRFWTDGWDGYPAARARLFDALASSGAANPVILAGDVGAEVPVDAAGAAQVRWITGHQVHAARAGVDAVGKVTGADR